jgi:branched-chain amino acid transport system substrate-binding protein
MGGKKAAVLTGGVCLFLVLAVLPFMARTARAEAPKTIRIGALMCLTGWNSVFDILELQEAELARDMINERGGITIKGQKYLIEIVSEDAKSSADGAVAAANKLIYDDKVKFIVGPSAFFASAVKSICEQNKVIRALAYTTNTPGELGPDTPYTFLCHNGATGHGMVGMVALKKLYPWVKSVDLTMPDDGSIRYLDPLIRNMLQQHGLAVVGKTISYFNEMVDYSPMVATLAASKADAVFMEDGMPSGSADVLKGLRELGLKKPVVGVLSGSPDDILHIVGPDAATNYILLGIMPNMPDTPPLLAEIQKRLFQKYGGGRAIHLQIFNGMWAFAKVIQAAQSLDTTAVKDKWEKMDTIETPQGMGHMGGLKTHGIKHALCHPQAALMLDNGKSKFGCWVDVREP